MQVLHFRVGSFPGCTAALFLLLALKLPGQVAETNLAVTVRHAPSLNGRGTIEGSLQLLSGENGIRTEQDLQHGPKTNDARLRRRE